MADGPGVPLPDVQQSSAPLAVNPPAAAFGTAGAALQDVGAATGKAADVLEAHAQAFQAINNKAESDQAWQTSLQTMNKTYADYTQLRGKAAYDALPGVMSALEDQRASVGETLSNPMAKEMYDADSRRNLANITGEATRFATDQRKAWVTDTMKGTIQSAQDELAGNPESFKDMSMGGPLFRISSAVAALNHELGVPDNLGQEILKKTIGGAVSDAAVIRANNGDPSGAQAFLDEQHSKGIMSEATYREAQAKIRPSLFANEAHQDAQDTVTSILSGLHTASVASANPPELASITTKGGQSAQVDSRYAKNFQGFLSDLEAEGYPVSSVGGYSVRNVAGTNTPSYHSTGDAIDINPGANAQGSGQGNLPANTRALAQKWGLGWGADFKTNNDPMHFSIAAEEGGSVNIPRGGSVNSRSGGAPTSYDLAASESAVYKAALAAGEKRYPGNFTYANSVAEDALRTLRIQSGSAKAQETQVLSQFEVAAADPNNRTLDAIVANTPNGSALRNQLPGPDLDILEAKAKANASMLTYDRATANSQFDAAYANAAHGQQVPQFLGMDPGSNAALSFADVVKIRKEQDEVRAGTAQASQTDKAFNQAVNSQEFKAELDHLGLSVTGQAGVTNPQLDRLQGILHGQIDVWTQTHGKPPTQEELSKFIYPSTWSRAAEPGVLKDITSNHYKWAIGALATQGNRSPNEADIGRQIEADRVHAQIGLRNHGIPVTEANTQQAIANYYGGQ